jgi:hypothetical protein
LKPRLIVKFGLMFCMIISLIFHLPVDQVQASDDIFSIPLPLEGRITDEKGDPVSGITVSAISPILLGFGGGFRQLGTATTDENGEYKIPPFLRFFQDQGIGTYISFTIKDYPVIRSLGTTTSFHFQFPTVFEHVEGIMKIEGTNLPNPGLPVVVGMRMTKRDIYVLSSSVTDSNGRYSMKYIPANFTTYDEHSSVVVSELTQDTRSYDNTGTSPASPSALYGFVHSPYGNQIGNIFVEVDGKQYYSEDGGFAINTGEVKNHRVKINGNGFVPFEEDFQSGGPYFILLEIQPPTVVASTDRVPDKDGWYNHDVTVSFEGQSNWGLDHVDPPQVLSTEGANQEVRGSASNIGGTGYGSIIINLDKTTPITSGTISGESGTWLGSTILTLSAIDGLSGVDKTEYSVDAGQTWKLYNGPTAFSSDGRYQVLYRSSDKAGNIEVSKMISFNIDASGPNLHVTAPIDSRYINSIDLKTSFTVEDNLSGVDASKTITMIDGQRAERGVAIPLYTLPLGSHIFSIKAADLVGNESNIEIKFEIYTDLDSLRALVKRFANEQKISESIYKTLDHKLEQRQLKPFISLVEAQNGKGVDATIANFLIRDATALQ